MIESIGIEHDADLARWTSFGVASCAERLVHCHSMEEVRALAMECREAAIGLKILGGGSNVLATADVAGTVMRMAIPGVERIDGAPAGRIRVAVGAGVFWHDFVMHSLDQGWSGLENLALIPGSVGASPMQNIGAYGVELEQRFAWLEAVDLQTGDLRRFDHAECQFGYRESVFKGALSGRFAIVRVAYDLLSEPDLKLDYGAIADRLRDAKITSPAPRDVAQAVMAIRSEKLPDPAVLGNAGSFFKNPVLTQSAFDCIREEHPGIPHYPASDGVKLAAGWLIEQSGWKGCDRGTHGVHDRQALVLVNRGGATGREILALSAEIQASVSEKFNVELQREVNIW